MKHSSRISTLLILLHFYGFGVETKIAQEQIKFSVKLNPSLPQNSELWTWTEKYPLENNHTGDQFFSNYELAGHNS
ncbi:unnamed protein product [Allacma fusca]|uniref:Uncharacterized protein n=1 Tax=Allacma fusca TaxID=39272 RepID=A0A8J2JQN5_9HEXA|nr:unnamed protein product [Allacma fusca]